MGQLLVRVWSTRGGQFGPKTEHELRISESSMPSGQKSDKMNGAHTIPKASTSLLLPCKTCIFSSPSNIFSFWFFHCLYAPKDSIFHQICSVGFSGELPVGLRRGWKQQGYEIGWWILCEEEMLLEGSFTPKFHTHQHRISPVASRRTGWNGSQVVCFSKSLPPPWCKNNEDQRKSYFQSIRHSVVSVGSIPKHPELSFDRLQPCEKELPKGQKRTFGRFVARSALLDEEYWTAAWLRAEAQWESVSYMRHVDTYKRKYAEQEFYAVKHRCTGRDGNSLNCVCIVTVKKEDPNVRRTVLNSVVGTLDLSIRQFLQGETFPGELKKHSGVLVSHSASDDHTYAYIGNLCVSKFARRQGIASNMLHLATDFAVSSGMKQLFVHVNADNQPAQDLYKKTGFKVVEAASSPLSKDQRFLMCIEL